MKEEVALIAMFDKADLITIVVNGHKIGLDKDLQRKLVTLAQVGLAYTDKVENRISMED